MPFFKMKLTLFFILKDYDLCSKSAETKVYSNCKTEAKSKSYLKDFSSSYVSPHVTAASKIPGTSLMDWTALKRRQQSKPRRVLPINFLSNTCKVGDFFGTK